jgi:ADP-ribose pyrophosphatase
MAGLKRIISGVIQMNEIYSIPGVGGIITKLENGIEFVLIQERKKSGSEVESGMIEIPAGKIREYESIYDCLRREVWEETGYEIESIMGEKKSKLVKINGYSVLNYEPFSCSQNIEGYYPIMVQVFICTVKKDNKQHDESSESKNIRWIKKSELKILLKDRNKIYPMHISTLEKYCSTN